MSRARKPEARAQSECGLKAVGTGQEVGERDAAKSEGRYEPIEAGDAGAALDPL